MIQTLATIRGILAVYEENCLQWAVLFLKNCISEQVVHSLKLKFLKYLKYTCKTNMYQYRFPLLVHRYLVPIYYISRYQYQMYFTIDCSIHPLVNLYDFQMACIEIGAQLFCLGQFSLWGKTTLKGVELTNPSDVCHLGQLFLCTQAC